MRAASDVHRLLVDAGVPHEFVHLARRVDHADDLPAALDVPATACVVLDLYERDGAPVAVLRPAGARPDFTALARAVGPGEWRLAAADEVSALTDCVAAYAVPVGLPASVPVVADSALAAHDVLYLPAGDCATALKVRSIDLWQVVGALLAPLAAPVASLPAG